MKEKFKNLKNKKSLLAIGILALALIGGTFAYYSTNDSFQNDFNTKRYDSKTSEVFTSPTNWMPGDTTPKRVYVTNTGDVCENVRVSYTEKWESENGAILPNTQNGNPLAILNLVNKQNWVKSGNYYYYNKNLEPHRKTSSFLESVTYNKLVQNDFECVQNGNDRECTSTGDGYDGATYTLTINIETIQCSMSQKVWGLDVSTLENEYTVSRLDTGQVVNGKWKTLAAGGTTKTYSASDSTITSIEKANSLPPEISAAVSTTSNKGNNTKATLLNNNYEVKQLAVEGTDYAVISTSNSTIPIYSWYDNGTIYYYSEAEVIDLNSDSSYLFYYLRNLTSIGEFEKENTSNVILMHYLFSNAGYNAATFNLDLSLWDTSSVTNMNRMFEKAGHNATSWSIGDLSNWDVGNVEAMAFLFESAGWSSTVWDIGDLSGWNTSNVTSMRCTFSHAGHSASTFNLDLSSWDVSKVEDMYYMFNCVGYSATTWSIGDLSSWDVSKVENMFYMFSGAGYSTTNWNIGDLSSWDVSKVNNMGYMFDQTGYRATTFTLDLSTWNTSSVTDMNHMFNSAGYNATTWSIGDLSTWNTSSVTNMNHMFDSAGYKATSWESIGTLKVYATNICQMFYNCSKAKATLNIYSNPASGNPGYNQAFYNAATASGALITVNYASTTTNIDNIIATKSGGSNVVKGTVIS